MVNKKPETTTTDNNEDNTEQLAREECARLARQLRLMENDKKAYLEESNAAINHQRKTIRALDEENRKISAEIEAHQTKRGETIEGENLDKILSLVDTYLELEKEVKTETRNNREVGKQLSFASARLGKLKAKIEASNAAVGARTEISNKEIDTKDFNAKKKLETVTAQFDSIVAENAEMRRQIDATLKENVRVMKRCKEIEKVSDKNKDEIDDLVDQATNAYDQREEAVAKANVLLERNEKEKKQHVLEISELKRLIRHEDKLLDFMSKKNQDRIFLETDDERLSRLESAKEQTEDDALESYRENLNKLLTKDSPTLAALVGEYAQLWSDNINRFNYINELNNDLETLQVDVENLRVEIKHCAVETVERNHEKTAEINKKQEELEILKDEYDSIEALVSSYKEFMEEIVKLIERMFYITDFEDAKPVLELIGKGNQEVSTQNSVLYLNILESRISEIFSSLRRSGGSGRATPTPKSPRPQNRTSGSDISVVGPGPSSRPRIIISEQTFSLNDDDDYSEDGAMTISSIVEVESLPLEYFAMRGKLMDNVSSRNPSDTESIVNNED